MASNRFHGLTDKAALLHRLWMEKGISNLINRSIFFLFMSFLTTVEWRFEICHKSNRWKLYHSATDNNSVYWNVYFVQIIEFENAIFEFFIKFQRLFIYFEWYLFKRKFRKMQITDLSWKWRLIKFPAFRSSSFIIIPCSYHT